MKNRTILDPRFANNPNTQMLIKQLMSAGDGKITNVGEGIKSAANNLTGAWLSNKADKETAQKQEDYYKTLNSLQMLNKESGGSNDDLINAMSSSSNPFIQQDSQGIRNQMLAEQLKPQKPETVGAGGTLVDPKTGKVIYNNPNQAGGRAALLEITDAYLNGDEKTRQTMDRFGKTLEKNTYLDDKGNVQLVPNAVNVIADKEKAKAEGRTAGEPLPTPITNKQDELVNEINISKSISSNLKQFATQIDNGQLKLDVIGNIANKVKNGTSLSTDESRNYASFTSYLNKMRNDSLALQKGTQTEGDATRAWDELISNINDPGVVKQRLGEIARYNDSAASSRENRINIMRKEYKKGELPSLPDVPSQFEITKSEMPVKYAPDEIKAEIARRKAAGKL